MVAKHSALLAILILAVTLPGCSKPEPLTAEKAKQIIGAWAFKHEPVYAEVPHAGLVERKQPEGRLRREVDAYAAQPRKAGLITMTGAENPDGSAEFRAKVTQKGFPILGTAPSYRGPVYRGKICEKVYDGLENFQRHPTETTTGAGELVWHYDNPTWLYPLFETKINKPLKTRFASHVSFYYKDHEWRFDVVTVPQNGSELRNLLIRGSLAPHPLDASLPRSPRHSLSVGKNPVSTTPQDCGCPSPRRRCRDPRACGCRESDCLHR
jgi:hypothetical protein